MDMHWMIGISGMSIMLSGPNCTSGLRMEKQRNKQDLKDEFHVFFKLFFKLNNLSLPVYFFGREDLYLKPPKFEHIFVAVIPFLPPFFCADTFNTSLLLIVCALR